MLGSRLRKFGRFFGDYVKVRDDVSVTNFVKNSSRIAKGGFSASYCPALPCSRCRSWIASTRARVEGWGRGLGSSGGGAALGIWMALKVSARFRVFIGFGLRVGGLLGFRSRSEPRLGLGLENCANRRSSSVRCYGRVQPCSVRVKARVGLIVTTTATHVTVRPAGPES